MTVDLSALARDAQADRNTAPAEAGVPLPRWRWKTRLLLPAGILLTTVGLIVAAAGDVLWPRTAVKAVPVLSKEDVEAQPTGSVVVQAPGWVEADPFAIGVSALTDGVVEDVLVLEGERVERGQVVARLVPDDARIALEEAEAILAEREAALSSAQAALAEAQQNWDNPIELRRKLQTAEAQLLEKKAEFERWPSELERERAHAVYLEAEYKRLVPLHEGGQASDIELIQARQDYAAQQAVVEATRRRAPIIAAQIARLEADVTAARADLRLRIADTRTLADTRAAVKRAEAAVAAARAERDDAALRMERVEVRSPADGMVMVRLAEPGSKLIRNMDNPYSAQVVRLYDPNKLQVRVDVPLVDAAKVGVGQPAEVVVDVLPDHVFDGVVSRVVHEADVQKNTLQVKVAIADPTPEIKPEMLARARFLAMPKPSAESDESGTTMQQLFVPQKAVFERDGQSYLWVADQVARVARRVSVTPGRVTFEDWVKIDEGVRPGDRVIVDAPADLNDGRRIVLHEE